MNEDKGNADKLILPEPSHIGIVTEDLQRTVANLGITCGVKKFTYVEPAYRNRKYHGVAEPFKFRLALVRVGSFLYELIQVIHGKTIYEDFIGKHGEGIHHMGYEIENLDDWINCYQKRDIIPIMSGEREGLRWAYIDTGEIIIELLDRSPDGYIV